MGGGNRVCKYFNTALGCRFGPHCRYLHPGSEPEPGLSLHSDLGEPIINISVPETTGATTLFARHSIDHEDVASFSWTKDDSEIAVPGFPRRLYLPAERLELLDDRDVYGREYVNNQRLPHPFTFEPLVRAVTIMAPSINVANINIVTGLNALRNLFSLAQDKEDLAFPQRDFRIDIEMIGQTIFLKRWHRTPASATQMTLCGYGRGFEEACTLQVAGCQDCTTHHRIIRRKFAGLDLLVQFEADAFVSTDLNDATESCMDGGMHSYHTKHKNNDNALRIRDIGTPLQVNDLVEVKSRSIHNDARSDVLIQLWLNGITKLFLGKHIRGSFARSNMKLHDEREALRQWEEQNVTTAQQFCLLLQNLHQSVLSGVGACEPSKRKLALVYKEDKNKLTLHRRTNDDEVLPTDLKILFGGAEHEPVL